MKILAVDVGTGTQDILLFDTRLDIENAYKLVLPAPTMIVFRRIQQATRQRRPVLLSGVMMGGGPSQWAAEDHAKAGLPVYATPQAASSFNDDLSAVQAMGIRVIAEEEAGQLALREAGDIEHIRLKDFDFPAIQNAFDTFGVRLDDLAAVAVAVFDHGDAPPDVSDRQFRFDYLDRRIRAENRLSAFAYLGESVPPIMTRLQAVVASAGSLPAPLVVMDTAPAAVLGAALDPFVAARPHKIIANVGNFHTLAFRMGPGGIEGVFEHHTGLLALPRLEELLRGLASGSLRHADVFDDHGHGALVYNHQPLVLDPRAGNLVVTGPRRSMLRESALHPYFAVPYGDMMIAGCFGLLAAAADLLPGLREPVLAALHNPSGSGRPPWEAEDL
jgi:uncharacterized protein (DUF1786 family)